MIEIRKKTEDAVTASGDITRQQTEEEADRLLRQIDFDRFVLATDNPRLSVLKDGRFGGDCPRRINTFKWDELYNRPLAFSVFCRVSH